MPVRHEDPVGQASCLSAKSRSPKINPYFPPKTKLLIKYQCKINWTSGTGETPVLRGLGEIILCKYFSLPTY
ncbi:MAG: hypothetical protein SXA11_18815 [Cyanobacteriota bacterium]|nr:hypothetical protein [Cyanobacteriota bacterium]